jgi:hypothetical protein
LKVNFDATYHSQICTKHGVENCERIREQMATKPLCLKVFPRQTVGL